MLGIEYIPQSMREILESLEKAIDKPVEGILLGEIAMLHGSWSKDFLSHHHCANKYHAHLSS